MLAHCDRSKLYENTVARKSARKCLLLTLLVNTACHVIIFGTRQLCDLCDDTSRRIWLKEIAMDRKRAALETF